MPRAVVRGLPRSLNFGVSVGNSLSLPVPHSPHSPRHPPLPSEFAKVGTEGQGCSSGSFWGPEAWGPRSSLGVLPELPVGITRPLQ